MYTRQPYMIIPQTFYSSSVVAASHGNSHFPLFREAAKTKKFHSYESTLVLETPTAPKPVVSAAAFPSEFPEPKMDRRISLFLP